MHSGFKEELRELMREGFSGGGLPRVFIGRKYVGGAEEIRRMHEEGQLEKLVEGCEMLGDGGGGGVGEACEACGDIRFVPCETCSGSCKIYYEGDDEEQEELEEGEETGEYGFQSCPDCNENGLIPCPICFD
jgi:glutaredoxin domain-containing cysteine-rich protein 1